MVAPMCFVRLPAPSSFLEVILHNLTDNAGRLTVIATQWLTTADIEFFGPDPSEAVLSAQPIRPFCLSSQAHKWAATKDLACAQSNVAGQELLLNATHVTWELESFVFI